MSDAIRVAIVDDYAVVVAGIASLLADESIEVIETDVSLPVITDVDVVLFDTFGQVQGAGIDLEDYVRDSGAKVVVYSWNLRPEAIAEAMTAGASGYLSKVLTGAEVVHSLKRIVNGEKLIMPGGVRQAPTSTAPATGPGGQLVCRPARPR